MDKFALMMIEIRRIIIVTTCTTGPVVINQPNDTLDVMDKRCIQTHNTWL